VRDGLWGQTEKWIKAGGALPADVKLSQELNAPSFTADKNNRYVATDKKALRKILGRSPDRADAVCLAIWGFASVHNAAEARSPAPVRVDLYDPPTSIDAYALDGLGSDPVYG
jgi:hypothetical protein